MAFIITSFNGLPLPRKNRLVGPALSNRQGTASVRCRRPVVHVQPSAAMSDEPEGGEEEETVSLEQLKARLASANQQGKQKVSTGAEVVEGEEEVDDRSEAQKEIDRLRAAEKFIQVDEGKFECPACGYVYEPEKGDARNGIPANTPFDDLPDGYTCPVCRTPKRRFFSQKKIIAGFADNQNYGFGSNSMTGGQKSLLIFGGLVLGALLLLSGYALN